MYNYLSKIKIFTFFVLFTLSFNAVAIAIDYNELLDGDIARDQFNLGLGINSISGVMGVGRDFDFDIFSVNIAADTVVRTISLDYELVTSYGDDKFIGMGVNYTLLSGAHDALYQHEVIDVFNPITDAHQHLFDDSLPLSEGTYTMSQSLFRHYLSGGDTMNYGGTWAYTMDFDVVSAVPLPAGVWLFASGLLGLIGITKRSNAKRALK